MKTMTLRVKPLAWSVIFFGSVVGSASAQPAIGLGGALNLSTTTSVSSLVPAVGLSQTSNMDVSGSLDAGFPDGLDAVQSVLGELGSSPANFQGLPGLEALGDPSSLPLEGLGSGLDASAAANMATEVGAELSGLGDMISPDAIPGSAVTDAASGIADELSARGNSVPDIPTFYQESAETNSNSSDSDPGSELVDEGSSRPSFGSAQAADIVGQVSQGVSSGVITAAVSDLASQASVAMAPVSVVAELASTSDIATNDAPSVSPADAEDTDSAENAESTESAEPSVETADTGSDAASAEMPSQVNAHYQFEVSSTLY